MTAQHTAGIQDGMTFGPFSRYAVHYHDGKRQGIPPCWMILDAESVDEVTGGLRVIRQFDTIGDTVAFVRSALALAEGGSK